MRIRALAGMKPKVTKNVTDTSGKAARTKGKCIKSKGEPMPLNWEAQHVIKLVKYSAHTGNIRAYLMGAVDTVKVRTCNLWEPNIMLFFFV